MPRKPYFHPSVGVSASSGKAARAATAASSPSIVDRNGAIRMGADASARGAGQGETARSRVVAVNFI